MGAESYTNYYPLSPKPCADCGEMLPAGVSHLHYTWLDRLSRFFPERLYQWYWRHKEYI